MAWGGVGINGHFAFNEPPEADEVCSPEEFLARPTRVLPISRETKTINCFIAEGSEVYGTVRHSIVSTGCTIGEGALIEDSVVMPGVIVESGAIVRHAILGENCRVCRNAVVGGAFEPSDKKEISVTSKGSVIEANTVLLPGEML